MAAALDHLTLRDFRSYREAELAIAGRSVFLVGANGAGKTNLIEAVSLISPGRGLRGASLSELGRKAPGSEPKVWAVSVRVTAEGREHVLGCGADEVHPGRRIVRIDAEPATAQAFADFLRPIWLSPAQDRLFLEAASERRRFFDRLVFAADPGHAALVAAYERALRERLRLLTEGVPEPAWLAALEGRMAKSGGAIVAARARTLAALEGEIERRSDAFPKARLSLSGAFEAMALAGDAPGAIEGRLREALLAGRTADAAAGRTLAGPHRGDLIVLHQATGRPAAECSTGEQKALILNLVLAQAARLSRAKSQPNPILLLDEVAAHLDPARRAALFDEIEALSLQAFLTGTEQALFAPLAGRFLGVEVAASRLTVMDALK